MNTATVPEKVLLAVRPVDLHVVSEVFGDEFDLEICYTLEQAIQHLDESIRLIVCGVRFDSGSMFELLSAAQANPHTKWVPYYLIAGEDAKYSQAILEGVRKAAKVRGASGFINLAKVFHDWGKQQAYERIRLSIRYVLATDNHTNELPFDFPESHNGRFFLENGPPIERSQ